MPGGESVAKKSKPIRNQRVRAPRPLKNKQLELPIQNGFGEALGFGGVGIGGGLNGPPFFAGPGANNQPVSSSNTLFNNLRWYLVSNWRQLISQLYVEIGLVQTIVDVPVDDGLRGGLMLKSQQLDEDQLQELNHTLEFMGDMQVMSHAAKWTRLFGGGGVLIQVDDQDPETELDMASIGPDTEVTFRACDLWELFSDFQNLSDEEIDLSIESAVQTKDYFDFYGHRIHKSRVMMMKGPDAPSFIRPRLRGWGLSVVENLVRSINQYLKAIDLTFEVLDEFKVDVYKLKNLVSTLLAPNGTAKVRERVGMTNLSKNYNNAIVLDSEDDWDHKQVSFDGLSDAMAGIRRQVASDMRMPITKLFGSSDSGGIGNTDQNDMENYNSLVESQVRFKLKFHIIKMVQIRCQELFQFIPDDLEIEFKPLRVLTAEQEENVKTQKFNRVLAAKQAGELTTEEFRDACNKGQLFDVKLDMSEIGLLPAEMPTEPLKEHVNPVKEKTSNSLKFDRASYEADGGDNWMSDDRAKLITVLSHKDLGLWDQCEQESREAFGQLNQKFAAWLYKKKTGSFN